MNTTEFSFLDSILSSAKENGDSLITVLQKAQEEYGWLSPDLIYAIAEGTGSSPAKVLGVATFYTQFRLNKTGKYLILLCKGTACHVNGADGIEKAVCGELGIEDGGTTDDGLFSLKTVACLGCCSLSPAMMINGETYGSLTPAKAVDILRGIKKEESAQ